MKNKIVAKRFAEGGPKNRDLGGRQPMAICNGVLYSYQERIAERQKNGRIVVYTSKRHRFSVTTTAHINLAYYAVIEAAKSPLEK